MGLNRDTLALMAGILTGIGAALVFLAFVSGGHALLTRVQALGATELIRRRFRLVVWPGQGYQLTKLGAGGAVIKPQFGTAGGGDGGESAAPAGLDETWRALRKPAPLILVPGALGLGAAIVARHPLLSPYLLLMGLLGALYLAYRQTVTTRKRVADDVRELVDAFTGFYRASQSTFTALSSTVEHLREGAVKAVVIQALRAYQTQRDVKEAIQQFYNISDPYLARFAMILQQSGEKGAAEVTGLLDDLSHRLRQRWITRLTAQGVFSALRGTLMVLLGTVLAIALAGITIPPWRTVYCSTGGRSALYIALTAVTLVGAAFFDRRMRLDEETLL